MTDELPVADASPDIRPIIWRGYPLHFAIPVVAGLVGVLLLLLGGAAAWFGGWWLATAFPIAIGSLFRDPRLAAVPPLVWALWVVIGTIAGPDAALANTPIPVAIVLGAVGAAGTYLAQRVIFPATDPEVIEEIRNGRTVPTLDDGADADPSIETLPVEDVEDLDPVLVEAFELADDIEPEDDAEADGPVQAEVEPDADADEPIHADADAEAEADADADADAPVKADADAGDEPEPGASVEAKTDHDAEPADDEPTDPLDEGQHVAEFAAITEADLQQAEADAPLPAATRAGKRRGKD